MQESVERELGAFNQLLSEDKPDIHKFRYADDSMFVVRP